MQASVSRVDPSASGVGGPVPAVVSWFRVSMFGSALGVVLLILCALPTVRHFLVGMGGSSVLRSISAAPEIPSPLLLRVLAFLAAALGLHALLGLLAVALAWLTEKCFPAQQRARLKIMLLWLAVLFAWVLLANAAWFPHSELGEPHAWAAAPMGFAPPHLVLACAIAAVVLGMSARAAFRNLGRVEPRRIGRTALVAAAIAAILASAAFVANRPSVASQPASALPNVIVIGVDSLRLDQLALFGGSGDAHVVDDLLSRARVFSDTTTPLARTFPSWMSILTGRHPRSTGAVFNLTGRDSIRPGRTLAHVLGERGYRTIFATDEVRFSNIDASYGFDDVITPVIGASDFVLGSIADMPLINLVNATPVGRGVLPDIHANRAAASTYLPHSFTTLLGRELNLEGATFLAVHFTLTHWPYYWADSPKVASSLDFREAQFAEYRASVRMVNAQVGQLLDLLRERGELANALVVVLSDHGEAMFRAGDSLLREGAPKQLVAHQLGHGNSVLSPTQYEVLLAFAGYGSMQRAVVPGVSASPASLEDVAPTVLDLLRVATTEGSFDGLSLRGLLQDRVDPIVERRVRFTETDFTLPRMLAGEFNVKWMAENAVDYYRVNPASGWVEIRPERLPAMMAYKERAAIDREWLMAALPAVADRTSYWLINRHTGEVRAVEAVPESQSDTVSILYRALQERFPGELQPVREFADAARVVSGSSAAP